MPNSAPPQLCKSKLKLETSLHYYVWIIWNIPLVSVLEVGLCSIATRRFISFLKPSIAVTTSLFCHSKASNLLLFSRSSDFSASPLSAVSTSNLVSLYSICPVLHDGLSGLEFSSIWKPVTNYDWSVILSLRWNQVVKQSWVVFQLDSQYQCWNIILELDISFIFNLEYDVGKTTHSWN